MNKKDFLQALDNVLDDEMLANAAIVHAYDFANEDIAQFTLRYLQHALITNANMIVERAINAKLEFTNYADPILTVVNIKGLATAQDKYESFLKITNEEAKDGN
jgi:hypothetical protein